MGLAMEMLETALEQVHTQEKVEEEHVHSVHQALMNVMTKEQSLDVVSRVAQHDAMDADCILQNYKDDIPEDTEKRRELAVSDLAHNVEGYAQERLHYLEEEEQSMREEEEEAIEELERLRWNEETLKEVMEELRSIQQGLDEWP